MPIDIYANAIPWAMGLTLGFLFFMVWQRDRQHDRRMREREAERVLRREMMEDERREQELSDARTQKFVRERKLEEESIRESAGIGSGGYIVVDLPDSKRGLFQDLLKGFEEYAKLKGYGVSFSVDTTFKNRIAFKFTLTDPDVVVGTEKVRRDLKEYLDKVTTGESFDNIPRVISDEEHDILFATLKNRISFLEHSYNLQKNAAEFYESIMRRAGSQQFLPAPVPSVIVQTGGEYNSQSYSALNSPQSLLGHGHTATNAIRISVTYKERKEQIDRLDDLFARAQAERPSADRDEVIRNVCNVKEELEQADKPDPGRIGKWLRSAKDAVQLGSLGQETVQAAKELFKVFGFN